MSDSRCRLVARLSLAVLLFVLCSFCSLDLAIAQSAGAVDDGFDIPPADTTGNTGGPGRSGGSVLKAEISHSEALPPLPAHMRQGAAFMLFAIQGGNSSYGRTQLPQKFQIPDWLAGRWQRTQSTETKRVELPSGKQLKSTGKTEAKVQERFGTFMDRDGVIWQVFTPQRASGEVDRGNVLDYHKVNRYNMEILDDKTVLVEVTASHMVVSKDKRLIVQSYQDEELNTYTRTKDGRAVTDSSVKVFDQMGRPIFLTRSVSDVVKIEPFINQASGAGSR